MNRRIKLASVGTVLAAAVVAWGLGLIGFVRQIPWAVVDIDTRTDAIVVLTGGSERLATGLKLLRDDFAGQVFVSGVHPGVDVGQIVRAAGNAAPHQMSQIEAGHRARDTNGNAAETAGWMQAHGYRSLRLVTANYHMPRSLIAFGSALPEAKVIPHPVVPPSLRRSGWWLDPATAMLIVSEYNKFLLSALNHRLGRVAGAGATRWL